MLDAAFHAARANFSGTGNPSANSRSSVGNVSNLSAADVGLSAKTDRFLLSCGAIAPPLEFPFFLSGGTVLSSQDKKIAGDKVVPLTVRSLFRRYQVLRLIPTALHGWVADRDSDCGRIP